MKTYYNITFYYRRDGQLRDASLFRRAGLFNAHRRVIVEVFLHIRRARYYLYNNRIIFYA